MRVLLLNPPFKPKLGRFSRSSRSPAITKSGTLYYPLWLAYATGVLDQAGHTVKLVDAPAKRLSFYDAETIVEDFSPDMLVIDTSTPSIHSDIRFAQELKKTTNAFTILVGTHVSALPEETYKLAEVDAIAIGEYDYTLRDLADDKDPETVAGLFFRGKKTPHREKITDLDALPFVSEVYKTHLDIKDYFFGAAQYPLVQIISGRGCPNYCKFCVYPQVFHSRKYRPRSAENLFKEFEYIKKELPKVREIGIEDDTFTVDKKRVKDFCKLIVDSNLKPIWYTNVRADLDLQTMNWMKKAGCRLVTVGFESGNQKILNNIKKGIVIKQIREFVHNSKKAGLLVHAAYMVGNIGETKETMEESLKMAKELNTDMAQFFPIMLYPGTESYEWAVKNRYLKETDFSKWLDEDGQYDCQLNTDELKREELFSFCDRALKEYYFRPNYLAMKTAQSLRNPMETYRNVRSAMQMVKNFIR